jgi:hypothetical protein
MGENAPGSGPFILGQFYDLIDISRATSAAATIVQA